MGGEGGGTAGVSRPFVSSPIFPHAAKKIVTEGTATLSNNLIPYGKAFRVCLYQLSYSE